MNRQAHLAEALDQAEDSIHGFKHRRCIQNLRAYVAADAFEQEAQVFASALIDAFGLADVDSELVR